MDKGLLIGAFLCALCGAVTDIREKRIPNWLTYGGILTAFMLRAALAGWSGAKDGLEGVLFCGGIFFVFFFIGGMGAGDVKLMAAVGGFAGASHAVMVVFATAVAGGVLAIFYVVAKGRVRRTAMNMGKLLQFHLTSGAQENPELSLQSSDALRLPYGVAIAAGTLYSFGTLLLRG